MREWFVFEGDWGGQIYATIPIAMTTVARARQALYVADVVEWFSNGLGEGIDLYAQEGRLGDPVWGGMGGGLLNEGLWLHPDLNPSLKLWVGPFLAGEIDLPKPETLAEWFWAEEFHFASRYYTRKGVMRKMRKTLYCARHPLRSPLDLGTGDPRPRSALLELEEESRTKK